jgi:hypothetical protein
MQNQEFLSIIEDPENQAAIHEFDAEMHLVHRHRSIAFTSGLCFFGFAFLAIVGFLLRDRDIPASTPLIVLAAGCYGMSLFLFVVHVRLGRRIDHEFIASFRKWSDGVETAFKNVIDQRNKTINPQAADLAQYFISFKKNVFAMS